jgi:hypothetical protein
MKILFRGTYHLHSEGKKSARQEASMQQDLRLSEDGGDTLL